MTWHRIVEGKKELSVSQGNILILKIVVNNIYS